MEPLTVRQHVCLCMRYLLGASCREIGRHLGISHYAVITHLERAEDKLCDALDDDHVTAPPLVEGLFRPKAGRPGGPSTRMQPAIAAADHLLANLETRLAERDAEREAARECMTGEWSVPPHVLRHHLDSWEMSYLIDHNRTSLTTSDYDAHRIMVWIEKKAQGKWHAQRT